ncbi:protein of unknown function DUF82 [Methylobacterium sp. 4-46]|uniref:Mut7-C RNAse domain-containing protein n=1 Tax=unclassified Methylobacterium TaxID=2615210 RepID=UPI000165C905|nr:MULTISPECIES: DUF5615 family PIN-like protein [Methylobacterium]ACA17566.1 protein of unknown function DUF82 [Methylobacterium sp. 4-46]WFT83243.1 DUF5615 family PIN-like protein [Methylobacterium nodulans]
MSVDAPPRWLCDEMLGRLARLLRAAGHDARLAAPGTPDRDLLALAAAEERILLTRDRRLAREARARALLIREERPEAQARQLSRLRAIDWHLARFSRCLVDNAPLRAAPAEEVAALPAAARAGPGPFRACPSCGRLYWPGSHVRRMLDRLDRLAGDAAVERAEEAPLTSRSCPARP